MRIGLFTDTYPPEINGVANSTYILQRQLEAMGHDVYVITTNSQGGVASHWEEDGKVLRFKGAELKFLYGYVLTSPFHFQALQEIKKLDLDIIHDQTEFGIGIFAHMCASQLNIPLVSTYHTTYEDYTHYVNFLNSKTVDSLAKKMVAKLSKLYGNSSVAVISPSEKTKDMLLKYEIRKDISVIPTGLVLDDFSPEKENPEKTVEIRSKYGFEKDDVLFVSVGRLAQEKSIDVVISCFQQAKKENIPIKLLLVGGGPDYDSLLETIKNERLQDMIKLSGPLPKDEIPDIYRAADAFISASLSETQGMTFIEALASGIPLFARFDDVLEHLITEGESGWYYSSEEEFVEKVRKFLVMSEEEKEAVKQACLKHVEPYSAKIFGEKVFKVYEDALMLYRDSITIDDVQVKDSYVQLYLLNGQNEELKLQVTMDDYANLGLRKGYQITQDTYQQLQKKETGVKAYQGIIRRIAIKDRTRKEIYDWLTKETECDIKTINKIVDKLEEKGYINDERYCVESINAMRLTLNGNDKIIRTLVRKGIPVEMVEQKLSEIPDTSEDDALKYALKVQNSVKDDSVRKQRYTITNKLIQRGFSRSLSESTVEKLDFSGAELRESDNLKKTANKAKKRYSSKYSSSELRNRVYRYCASQGYSSSDIYAVMDEMEWSE